MGVAIQLLCQYAPTITSSRSETGHAGIRSKKHRDVNQDIYRCSLCINSIIAGGLPQVHLDAEKIE